MRKFIAIAVLAAIASFHSEPFCRATETTTTTGPVPVFREPIAVWDAFLTALRCGQMPETYRLLLPSLRGKISYRDFCLTWHPLGKNYAAVLSPPLFSEFCIAGDLAYLRLGTDPTGNFIHAYLAYEDNNWGIIGIDPRNAATVILEISARDFLRQLWKESRLVRDSINQGKNADLAALRRELPVLFAQENARRVLGNYDLEIDNLRDGVVRLRPRTADWRGFEYDGTKITVLKSSLTTQPDPQNNRENPSRIANPVLAGSNEKMPLPELDDDFLSGVSPVGIAATGENRKKLSAPPIAPKNLPDLPPDFGNPDWHSELPIANSQSTAEGNRVPEIDGRDELLMIAPNYLTPPPTAVQIIDQQP